MQNAVPAHTIRIHERADPVLEKQRRPVHPREAIDSQSNPSLKAVTYLVNQLLKDDNLLNIGIEAKMSEDGIQSLKSPGLSTN
jgi:hypothetical protein